MEIRELTLLGIYAAGMAALFRSSQSEGRSAFQHLIDARLAMPCPLPSAWIPVEHTYKNFVWRGFLIHVESTLIETGQLSPEQLGDGPDEYCARVEEAASDLMPSWFARLEEFSDKLGGRKGVGPHED